MKYVLKKNGTYAGETKNLNEAMLRAQTIERGPLSFQGEDDYWFAFGKTVSGTRTEWEIDLVKRKRA